MTPYYNDGKGIVIYKGDCNEILPALPKVSLILTDPPYGMDFRSNSRTATVKFNEIKGDDVIDTAWLKPVVDLLVDGGALYLATRWDVWPYWEYAVGELLEVKNCIVWAKPGGGMGDLTGDYSPEHEFLIYAVKGKHQLRGKRLGNVWTIQKDPPATYVHPTQKPVALMLRAIGKSTDAGDLVIDPFMGSGTTLLAAKQAKRRAIGIEIEEAYCKAAVRRLEQKQVALV